MKISYDPEVDALFILLRDAKPCDSLDLEEGVTVALDEKGHIIGLEVLDARERLGAEAVENVAIEKVLSLKESR